MHAVRRLEYPSRLEERVSWVKWCGDGERRQSGGWLGADRTASWSAWWLEVRDLDHPHQNPRRRLLLFLTHFTNKETGSERLSNLPNSTQQRMS